MSTSSSKNKNLLAARSALGMDGAAGGGGKGSVGSSTFRGGGDGGGSISRGSGSAARSRPSSSRPSYTARGSGERSTGSSASGAVGGGIGGGSSKHSFIHDLSATARLEARRHSSSNYLGRSDESILLSQASSRASSSRGSDRESSRVSARSNASSSSRPRTISPGMAPSAAPSTLTPHSRFVSSSSAGKRRPSYASRSIKSNDAASAAFTLEEGSEMDSMTAKPLSITASGGSSRVNRRGSRGSGTIQSSSEHLSSFARAAVASSRRDSRGSGSGSGAGSFGRLGSVGTSTTGSYQRPKPSLTSSYDKHSSYNSSGLGSGSSDAEDFGNSSSFQNAYEEKMTNVNSRMAVNQSIDREGYYNSSATLAGVQEFEQSSSALLSISEQGANSLMSPGYNDSQLSLTQSSTQTFVPQRFDEMRSLLMAITPLQLEALMVEIFGNETSNNFPLGWNKTAKKARSRKFRKDAYLSEMSLAELRRWASDKNLGLEGCGSLEEAMDVIAVEFERLVSCHQQSHVASEQSGLGDSDLSSFQAGESVMQGSYSVQESVEGSAMQESFQQSMQSMQAAASSATSNEDANLRRSLRACSLPELRLVAERLQLDHTQCNDKAELILMIENSMPDMMSMDDDDDGEGDVGGFVDDEFREEEMQQQFEDEEEYLFQQQQQEQQMYEDDIDEDSYYPQQRQGHAPDMNDNYPEDGQYDQQQYDEADNEYYSDQQHDLPSQPLQSQDMDPPHRKVKFSTDCKEDKSHLIPKREKGNSWQSFVVGSANNPGGQPTTGGPGVSGMGGGDEEYGEEDYFPGRPLVRRGSDDGSNSESSSKRSNRSRGSSLMTTAFMPAFLKNAHLPGVLKGKEMLKILGFLVVVGAAVGLGLGLSGNKEETAEKFVFDPNDPFVMNRPGSGLVNGGDNGMGVGRRTDMPSAMPSVVGVDNDDTWSFLGKGSLDEENDTLLNEKEEDEEGKTDEDEETDDDAFSFVASFITTPTPKPSQGLDLGAPTAMPSPPSATTATSSSSSMMTAVPVEGTGVQTDQPSSLRPVTPVPITITAPPSLTQYSETATTTPYIETTAATTPQPTTLSPYPLQGPFALPSLRMILYGISSLNHMGQTQWRLLTAAYMEHFFNTEGVGTDAIQNIVFDVVVSLELTQEFGLEHGVIVGFTCEISYRTFSAFITAESVAERPFFDEEMRLGYVQFLVENNGMMHMGNVVGVSELFREGDDLPEIPEGLLIDEGGGNGVGGGEIDGTGGDGSTPTMRLYDGTELTQGGSDSPAEEVVVQAEVRQIGRTMRPTVYPTKEPMGHPTIDELEDHQPAVTPIPAMKQASAFAAAITKTAGPSPLPTEGPTLEVTPLPTKMPTSEPTFQPTPSPTPGPTPIPPDINTPTPNHGHYHVLHAKRPVPSSSQTGDKTTSTGASAANVVIDPPTSSPSKQPTPHPAQLIPITPQRTFAPTSKGKVTTPARTFAPTSHPTNVPTTLPTTSPTGAPTNSPTQYCASPVTNPICPLLNQKECCSPMCHWDATLSKCDLKNDNAYKEVEWMGEFEIGQTHVIKAENERRHAPRVIAQREAELLFTPSDINVEQRHMVDDKAAATATSVVQNIESLGSVYLLRGDDQQPILDYSAQGSIFSLPATTPNIGIVVDLDSLRIVEEVSITLHGESTVSSAKLGLHHDDGRNQEEEEGFHLPDHNWAWFDIKGTSSHHSASSTDGLKGTLSITITRQQARYVMIRLEGGNSSSESSSSWGFGIIEIRGSVDGLSPDFASHGGVGGNRATPIFRTIDPTITSPRSFVPSLSTTVRVAVYSSTGQLIGATAARDPSKQRDILERRLSPLLQIQDYSDSIWSATLPYNWVEEGNTVLIGCVDDARPEELLVRRLEFEDLAQFSEHTVTRTKLAIFGSSSDVAHLDSTTHSAKRLVRNLFSVMPVAELKWADTDLWHLPYVVVVGQNGKPVVVNSEEERRAATGDGDGTEISWSVLKNHLTIRHSLANTGHGFAVTSEQGENSPYASGTSVFMGWSLSKKVSIDNEKERWEWEDLGYWNTLAAAAWTGWCAMKAGDECSNYFVHEMGHAQTMQHFDDGTAAKWGIGDEYPSDGQHMSHHPWGYDTVTRQFRTWFDPFQGDGKLDPLNGAGEGPTSDQCFSQYTPYQAKKSQEWAMSAPILLSTESSGVSMDWVYKFDPEARQYFALSHSLLDNDVGPSAMPPDQVGIPVITLTGTIGHDIDVCQTYPALRSPSGNTFHFPDPFSPDLPKVFHGAAHYIEVRFDGGRTVRGLIAAERNLSDKSLKFFSFNVAIHRRPLAVSLYRFPDASYPNLTPQSKAELLHLRPTGLIPDHSLEGLPSLLKVGRGWLGDSSDIVLDRFCETASHCNSDEYSITWRSDVSYGDIVYKSTLVSEPRNLLDTTVFRVPVKRKWDSTETEYYITVLATRFFSNGLGSSPLLATELPLLDDGSSDIGATHGIRVVAPWEMNASLPPGTYHSIPGTVIISALAVDGNGAIYRHLIHFNISLLLGTITESPTRSPTKRPTPGPTRSPVQVRYYIDWNSFTCRTDGESTEWAPPHITKEGCCRSHMSYELDMCMRDGEDEQ